MATMPYAVATPVFEGPFDLLLHLILREQVELYEVSLAHIVDEFIAELGRLQELDLDITTEFLLIAATLVELKARRLLPGADGIDLDDELALWEERDLLLARLIECKTFKDTAAALARLSALASRSVPRRLGPEERFAELAPDLLAGVRPADLRAAFLRATAAKPHPRIDLDHVAPIRVSVTDAVAELAEELPRLGPVTFRRLTGALVDRLAVVVRFLAVLELFKQGLVDLNQSERFGDITVRWLGEQAPEGPLLANLATIDAYDG